MIVYDPGTGTSEANRLADNELFNGWSLSKIGTTDGSTYSSDSDSYDIEQIRTYLEGLTIAEDQVLNVYARIFKVYTVTYIGEGEVSVGADKILLPASEDSADYTIVKSYTPSSNTQNFEGWKVQSGIDNISAATLDGAAVEAP